MYREAPVVAPILVVAFGGKVFGVSRRTGEIEWRVKMSPTFAPAELLVDEELVVACDPEVIVFIDYHTGAIRKYVHRTDTAANARSIMLLDDSHVFIGGTGNVACYTRDGERVWDQGFPGEGYGAVALGLPGKVRQADDAGSR